MVQEVYTMKKVNGLTPYKTRRGRKMDADLINDKDMKDELMREKLCFRISVKSKIESIQNKDFEKEQGGGPGVGSGSIHETYLDGTGRVTKSMT